MRQLSKGYNNPIPQNNATTESLPIKANVTINDASRQISGTTSRVQVRTSPSSVNSDDVASLIRCDCELTRTNRFVDVEGGCRRSDSLIFESKVKFYLFLGVEFFKLWYII